MTGTDDFLAKLRIEWRSAGGRGGPYAADGIRVENAVGEVHLNVGSLGRPLTWAWLLRSRLQSTETGSTTSRSTRRTDAADCPGGTQPSPGVESDLASHSLITTAQPIDHPGKWAARSERSPGVPAPVGAYHVRHRI